MQQISSAQTSEIIDVMIQKVGVTESFKLIWRAAGSQKARGNIVLGLMLMGVPQSEIADDFGLSQSTISKVAKKAIVGASGLVKAKLSFAFKESRSSGMNAVSRFLDYVSPEPNSGCWLYTGVENGTGYGVFTPHKSKNTYAHRFSYEHFNGPIPKGMHIDHRCRVRCCVNPDHLEAVTPGENSRRAAASTDPSVYLKSHCRNGHAYTAENVAIRKQHGSLARICKTCDRASLKRYRDKRHARE